MMLDILKQVESQLVSLLKKSDLHTMYIDYHDPIVERIWFQYGEYRVYLHKIYPCKEALFHPHPWKSAVRVVVGKYEMGIGHSEDNTIPQIDARLILDGGSAYEMVNPYGWHYVKPIDFSSYSIMVTGEMYNRKMPVEPNKNFRELRDEEKNNIIQTILHFYETRI